MKIDFIFTKQFLFAFVILVAFVIFFHRLSEAPLSGDGIGYGQIAKEMSISGDYSTPKHDGVPNFYTSKPPLLFWMSALSGNIFGFNNFSVKFPVAVLAFLSIIAMFLFVSKYYDFNTAFFSCIILIFTHQYMVYGRNCVTDGPFAFFSMIALMSFWIANTENKAVYYYLMATFIGLSIMTKQVFGLFNYFIIFGYIFLAKDFKTLKNIHFYLSFLIVPVIVLPWHIAMYNKYGKFFLNQYLSSTFFNIQGYAGHAEDAVSQYLKTASIYERLLHEWYAYLQKIVENYWPWLPFLVYGIYKKFKNIKIIYVKNKKDIFILAWIFIPLIILQTATRKNANYLIFLYPAFALICAEVFNGFAQKTIKKNIVIFISATALLCMAFISFPIVPSYIDRHKLSDPVKIMPVVKNIAVNEKIIIREFDNYAFSSMFLFYADKGNTTLNDENFEKELVGGGGKYFFSSKDNIMAGLLKKHNGKIKILAETEDVVLLKN
ncbi:hypothetical protein MASR1M68_15830 [Elusimicrobiota bacterium]